MKKTVCRWGILGLMISACAAIPTVHAAENAPVTLGATLPLSGPGAFDGQLYKNGMDVMLQILNGKPDGLGPVTANYYDTGGTPEEAVSVTQLAMDRDKVNAVIGGVFSREGLATKEVTRDKILNVMLTAQHPDILKQGHKWLFRIIPSVDKLADNFANTICSSLTPQPKTLAYISINDEYGRQFPESYKPILSGCGISVVGNEVFGANDVDFVSPLTKIRSEAPDVMFIVSTNTSQTAAIVRQSRQVGYKGTIVVAPGNINQKLIELAGPALNGVYSELLYSPDSTNPTAVAWREAYLKQFSDEPSVYGAIAAEAAQVIAFAMQKAGSVSDYDKVAAALKGGTIPTLLGDVTFDDSGQALQDLVIVQVQSGKIKTVARIPPDKQK